MMTAPAPAATASPALAITNDDRKPPNDASVREAVPPYAVSPDDLVMTPACVSGRDDGRRRSD